MNEKFECATRKCSKRILLVVVLLELSAKAYSQPTITQQPMDQVVTNGGMAVFSVLISGNGPFSYQWKFNGANLSLPAIITTIAGNGTNIYSGDGGSATNASLIAEDVTQDSTGNLFIDSNNYIRKVNTNGIITTIAGIGTSGYSGDGGQATNAMIYSLSGIAIDDSGNVFIADTYNNRIRKVSTNGTITTVAGLGVQGFYGDGGTATNAALNSPFNILVDTSGNLFISDTYNNRIRKVNTNGIITTIAGIGTSGYSGDGGQATNAELRPKGLAMDSSNNLYLADTFNNCIRKISPAGIITTAAGNGARGYAGDGGQATNGSLFYPFAVMLDKAGTLFVADTYNSRIRKVDTNGIITTVAGSGLYGYSGDGGIATNAMLSYPTGLTEDFVGNLLIADEENGRIRAVGLSIPTFYFTNISSANAGNYSVVITSPSGSITSSVATLTVVPLFIAQQPQSVALLLNSNATFNVTTSGAMPMFYQWYFSNPALQTTAQAKAQISGGFVFSTVVTNAGSGYTTLPRVQFAGGGGNGAGGTVAVSSGKVTSITVTNAGSGYTSPPAVLIDPPNGLLIGQTNATLNLNAITTNNFGNYFVVISNIYGSLTSSVATLSLAYPPSFTQQPISQTIGAGSAVNFTVAASGTPPLAYQWWMVASHLTNATATPLVTNGFVLGATITKGGAGYLAVPAVQFIGGSGSGAGGISIVSNRMVTAIIVTNAGSGYTTHPTIQIAAPTAISFAGQTGSVLTLAVVTNTDEGNYYVVVTNNFGSVTSQVAVLTVALPGYNQITSLLLTNGSLRVSFVGLAGTNYVLDRTFSLSPVTWIPQATNRAGASSMVMFTNTPNMATNNFWRIRSMP